MRILADATVFDFAMTGIAKANRLLYEAVVSRHPDVEILGLQRLRTTSSSQPSLRFLTTGTWMPSFLWRGWAFPRVAKSWAPDFVHFPWNGKVIARSGRAKIITTLHDVLPLEIPQYFANVRAEKRYRKDLQRDLDLTDILFTASEYSKEAIKKNFTFQQPIVVLQYGPTVKDLNNSESQEGDSMAPPYFLYVGGYDPRKGLVNLLKALHQGYQKNLLKSKLLLVGEPRSLGPGFDSIRSRLLRTDRLEERGYVSDTELRSLYRGALALVYPSLYEGFGLPPLEAMTLGCPVITTRGTSLPEVCGDAPIYVNPRAPDELLAAMRTTESNAVVRSEMIRRGRLQASKFSWDTAATVFTETLRQAR